MKANSEKLRYILDKMNSEFLVRQEYYFCRCYDCAFSVLLNHLQQFSNIDNEKLGEIIQQINSDYLHSADYRDYLGKSGLRCGYDCNRYEEGLEAVPFLFWEIDKSHLKKIEKLLSDNEFQECFSIE